MIKTLIAVIFNFLIFSNAWACPGCAGSMDNPKDTYIVYILMVFIGLIYIPFTLIYRTIIKNRRLNDQLNEQGQ
ncbi:MAG: hypothetical protein CME70_06525 [Halobacteriovorax sp.]|nr:hypothetical protein [Halobacteriovorax sp.]|tara:strand:+ start:547876 stop:548097 length:222 start_codon:yes stop_codon:yes gene_type:complete